LAALVKSAIHAVAHAVGESISLVENLRASNEDQIEILLLGADVDVARRAGVLAVELLDALLAPPTMPARLDVDFPAALTALRRLAEARRPSMTEAAILAAAEERQIPVIRFDRWPFHGEDTELPPERRGSLQVGQGAYRQRIVGTGTTRVPGGTYELLGDREGAHAALRQSGIPVPTRDLEFTNVNNARRAVRSAQRIGYPVVLKPRRGPSGLGTSVNLASDEAVASAFDLASHYDRHVIVERQIVGEAYRLLIIGDEVVAVCQRPSADDRASHPSPIAIDPVVLSADWNAIALRATRCFGLAVAGVDILSPDPRLPFDAGGGAVVRVDPAPDLALHRLGEEAIPLTVGRRFLAHLFPPGVPTRIPIAAITGTAGKTTTCRMVARILDVAGYRVGLACSDGVYIGRDLINRGVFSGISGALQVFSDPRVEVAVLEVSRGTLVQRGMGFDECTVGACTKVQADHIGLEGIESVAAMARLKRVVVEQATEFAVLNAEDPGSLSILPHAGAKKTCLVSTDPTSEALMSHIAAGGMAVVLETVGNAPCIIHREGALQETVIAVGDMPSAWGGAARHNIQNALFATAMSLGLGVGVEDIRRALRGFESSPTDSPNRINRYDKLPFDVILDRAGTVPGFQTLCDFVDRIPAHGRRVLAFYGHGDRRDEDLRAMAQRVARSFDRFICFEAAKLRGRQPGEVPTFLASVLAAEGVPAESIFVCPGKQEGVQRALALAEAGDLVVIASGGRVEEVFRWLDEHTDSAPAEPSGQGAH
jgi:cyanophycin synthetase